MAVHAKAKGISSLLEVIDDTEAGGAHVQRSLLREDDSFSVYPSVSSVTRQSSFPTRDT
jgi:hypothetical protein